MKARDVVRMAPDEIEEFLRGRHSMAVATIGPDGRPHVVAMWYAFLDGAPAFETYRKSQKVLNLRRDPRISCMIDDGERYEELRGVELVGTGTVLEDRDALVTIAEGLFDRYHGGLAGQDISGFVESMIAKRVVVRIDVEQIVSWDHRKLGLG